MSKNSQRAHDPQAEALEGDIPFTYLLKKINSCLTLSSWSSLLQCIRANENDL